MSRANDRLELIVALNCNDPRADETNSFTLKLHETDIWDEALYWKLDKAVIELAARSRKRQLPRKVVGDLVQTFHYIFGRLAYHRMPSDQSSIRDFSVEDCREWAERVEFVFIAAICGHNIDNDAFNKLNPLLQR